ncbi:MAG: glycerol-3-phosphate dehydrogenase/oxidase, partial [Saprospiraceae bacterium]
MLSKKEALSLEPLLNEGNLKGGGYYAEYRTDDARLTIELIKTAQKHSALALNYCEGTRFIYQDDKLEAVECKDVLTGTSFQVKATQVVSAGGAWVDQIRTKDNSMNNKRLHHTKGVHLVFPHDKFPLKQSVYFDVPDGRMIFAIPRGRATYVGTTDTTYHGSLNKVLVTQADVGYILNAIQHAFPAVKLSAEDVESSWAGLRPLIHEDGKSPSELSRKDEIFESDTGLISIAGGKLTGYRKMAERVVDLVTEKLKGDFKECNTSAITLSEDALANTEIVNEYIKELSGKMESLGLSSYHAWYLTTTYGKSSEIILAHFSTFEDAPEVALARAELWYAVHYEMAHRLEDFFVRRTGQLYFDIENIAEVRKAVAIDLQQYLKWDEAFLAEEQKRLSELIHDATHFYEEEKTKS